MSVCSRALSIYLNPVCKEQKKHKYCSACFCNSLVGQELGTFVKHLETNKNPHLPWKLRKLATATLGELEAGVIDARTNPRQGHFELCWEAGRRKGLAKGGSSIIEGVWDGQSRNYSKAWGLKFWARSKGRWILGNASEKGFEVVFHDALTSMMMMMTFSIRLLLGTLVLNQKNFFYSYNDVNWGTYVAVHSDCR